MRNRIDISYDTYVTCPEIPTSKNSVSYAI